MTTTEITEQVNALGHAWHEFKQTNDARLREIARKGSADGLLLDKLHNIDAALDHTKQRLDAMETAASRPGKEAGFFKTEAPYANEYKGAFCNYLRKGQDAELAGL